MSARERALAHPGDRLEVRPIGMSPIDQAYRPFLVASLSMATLVGFVLAIHVPLQRLLGMGDPARSIDLVQAHGQVQLLGFAGLFVVGTSLRLMPRFAGGRVAFELLVPVTLALFVGALVLRAVVMPWFSGDLHTVWLLLSCFGVLIGSACFLMVTAGTLTVDARRFEASSLAFLLGAVLLFISAAVATLAAVDIAGESRSLPLLVDNAVLQLELLGFLCCFILGVGLRAIPPMVGIERPGRSAGILVVTLACSVLILALSLLFLEYVSFSHGVVLLVSAAFLTTGVVLLSVGYQAGVLRQAANRLRPASQPNLWLIRSAFVWMIVAAIMSVYAGGSALIAGELPSQFEFDAVRHALGVGMVTMLITGMAMTILPEFGLERQQPNQQRNLALALVVLLNASAFLRVLPALAGASWSFDERNLSMAIGGSLAELAMLLFAAYLIRLMRWHRA